MLRNSAKEKKAMSKREKKQKKTYVSKETVGRLFGYLKPYWVLIVLSFLMSAAAAIGSLYVPIMVGKMIDLMTGVNLVDLAKISSLVGITLGIIGVSALFEWLTDLINNRIVFNLVRDIRKDAFDKLQTLPLSYIDSHSYGDIVSRVIADVEKIADGLLLGMTQLFNGIVTIVATLVFMYTVNPIIATVVFVLTPLSLFTARFIVKKTNSKFKEQAVVSGEITGLINEVFTNQKTVKAYSQEDEIIEKFDEVNDRLEKCSTKAVFFSSLTNPTTRFVNSVVYLAVALSGALACLGVFGASSLLTVGSLSSLLAYANKYTKPFNEISGVITEMQNAFISAGRVFELLSAESEVISDNPDTLENVEGNVKIENVAFSYDKSKKLIENLNLDAYRGMHVAIVGPTGCGKSTLINLLMRFYDVDEGAIYVDGKDIRTVTRESLRSGYGMVLQETWLKAGTIKENIAFGKPDATDEEIIAAAKASSAHNFIMRLPNGYDTYIEEYGGLSEGQRQLLCISRVMLRLPPVLILDEATSSIDTRTEMKIQKAFADLTKGKTSFIVAHRLSTIEDADIILVMKSGKIIEQGSHKELLAQNGFYKELYEKAFAK